MFSILVLSTTMVSSFCAKEIVFPCLNFSLIYYLCYSILLPFLLTLHLWCVDFDIEHNGLEGHALHHKGFAYCWSGARATVGIRGGKYCFACKVIATQPVDMEDTPSDLCVALHIRYRVQLDQVDQFISNEV
jgi:hypothetical protein